MAELKFYYGTMGAGKSVEAIKTFNIMQRAGRKPYAVQANPGGDGVDYNGEGYISSRLIDTPLPAYIFTEVDNIPKGDYQTLIVDEVQFLPPKEIDKLAELVDNQDKTVICYGLKTDCYGNLFKGSARLLAIADVTKELEAICDICHDRPATRHLRYFDGVVDKGGKSPVALKDAKSVEYLSVCRQCWNKELGK